jgi:pilus assembly protein CpaB
MRAVALRVNDVVGLAGFVLPGMRVDVLVAGNPPGGEQSRVGLVSRTVLQNLEVLSANQRIDRTASGKPEDAQVVNLLVTPDEAEILNLASGEAKVQLVLRNPLDTKEQVTRGSSSLAMYGGPQTLAPAAVPRPRMQRVQLAAKVEAPKPQTVEVFSGTKRSEQRFDSAQGDQ